VLSPDRLLQRCNLLQAVRSFFLARDYMEVDTPIRQPVVLPESQIEFIEASGCFLQSSPEQYMKRLLACENKKIFQLCPCFRRYERGRLHSEEFTMLEWYQLGWSYLELMEECEDLIRHLAEADRKPDSVAKDALQREGHIISLKPPWPRLTVAEAFARYADLSVDDALIRKCFDQVLVEQVEPQLGWSRPVFLVDYPVELASLARKKSDNDAVTERFELYIGGIELANGFSELTDPNEQRSRFQAEQQLMIRSGKNPGVLPEKFLAELERLDDCAGIALGWERLLLILWEADTLGEVAVFAESDL
jgi:lysyl-tRNA synthetase class 2